MRAPVSRRRPTLRLLLVIALAGTLAACSSDGSDEGASEAATGLPAPGVEAAEQALEEGRTVIDVRTPEEFAEGHIAGATRIGLADEDFADRIAELDADEPYVVYCRTGNRSATAAAQMRELGLDVIDGGGLPDMEAGGWSQGE
jgi:rhodanese-related sulfurtransferase